MANIAISDLRPVGTNLFHDSESFMMDLSDVELNMTHGASPITITTSSQGCILGAAFVIGAVIGWLAN